MPSIHDLPTYVRPYILFIGGVTLHFMISVSPNAWFLSGLVRLGELSVRVKKSLGFDLRIVSLRLSSVVLECKKGFLFSFISDTKHIQ